MEKYTCPICSGKGRISAENRVWKRLMQGYNRKDDSFPCMNCGGQYQFGVPTGQVDLDVFGSPCVHEYKVHKVSGFAIEYVCDRCQDQYVVDALD